MHMHAHHWPATGGNLHTVLPVYCNNDDNKQFNMYAATVHTISLDTRVHTIGSDTYFPISCALEWWAVSHIIGYTHAFSWQRYALSHIWYSTSGLPFVNVLLPSTCSNDTQRAYNTANRCFAIHDVFILSHITTTTSNSTRTHQQYIRDQRKCDFDCGRSVSI